MWPCHAEHVKAGQDVTQGPGIVGYMCMRLCGTQHLQDFFISKAVNHPTLAQRSYITTLTQIKSLVFLCSSVLGQWFRNIGERGGFRT